MTFIVQDSSPTGLQAAIGRTRLLEPHEIGTSSHAQEVATSVRSLLGKSGIPKETVQLVLIKCPLLTSEKVEIIKAASNIAVTTDTYEPMAKSRYASAVGIAAVLEERNYKKVASMRQCGMKRLGTAEHAAALGPS